MHQSKEHQVNAVRNGGPQMRQKANRRIASWVFAGVLSFSPSITGAQQSPPAVPGSDLITRSITAIGYQVGGGATTVDLKSTGLIAQASGQAKVEAKPTITTVEADIKGLSSPQQLGTEFLTYVLWAVSPEGRASNVGEVLFDKNGNGKLKATTHLQTFSLFLTAEPYSAVRQPSEMLILENELRKNTKGKIFPVNDYKLMKRSQYEKLGNPLALSLDLKNVPLQMYEARNAVEIAKSHGADRYAADIFAKAQGSLQMAESALASKSGKDQIISTALQTEQFAEDARALAVERQDQERIASEREAAAAGARAKAEAKAAAEAAEAKRRADEEAQRQAELAAAREAQMKAQAELEQTKAQAQADALRAKEEAARADAERSRQAAEQLRAQLLEQFNRVLATRDTPRGLVITMGDVLFQTGKYDLRPDTQQMLSKVSGILLAHPGLNLSVEGYTDTTGTDAINQRLSQQRADTVREYLISQGLPPESITSQGFGSSNPVASNDTAAGRQQNRRVELIVSGEIIGAKIGK
jgi:outer membrane protein OmpA-like peptidoglycan-associated protein